MHDRYPASNTKFVFSDARKLYWWHEITNYYASASMLELGILEDGSSDFWDRPTPSPEAVRTREHETGHDVVAFLSMLTQDMPDHLKRHIHRGLTSSDLVEYAHHRQMAAHAALTAGDIGSLRTILRNREAQDTMRVGRTHGQVAAPTSLNHQLWVIDGTLERIQGDLERVGNQRLIKTPGPTGMTPWLIERGKMVVDRTDGTLVRSTQMIPRDFQLEWAALYLRLAGSLENLALLVRLGSRTEVGEIQEGDAKNRVGSSAMPHKKNPIDSEKVCGLARVARGYFATIAENVAFWEDRDLTNSSVERIVVPDLAAVVEHMLDVMTVVMGNLQFKADEEMLTRATTWSALAQTLVQEVAFVGPIEASAFVRACIPNDQVHVNYMAQEICNALVDSKGRGVAEQWFNKFNQWTDEFL